MKILIGNIFESKVKTLVNTVNCVGVMGKGLAEEFKKRYPKMYNEYVILCQNKKIKPGEPYYYENLGTSIINFPTKNHWRSPSKLSYIIEGLKWFNENYESLGIKSIAFPPLGCGNGGLDWNVIGPIMYNELKDLPIEIEIYAPYGTKNHELTLDYLIKNLINNPNDILGIKNIGFNKNWFLILETINRLNKRKYVLSVGRTVFQKICYVLTLSGVKTGFKFVKGTYGPYCKDVNIAITAFSNANLIREKLIGNMIEMQVTDNFQFNQNDFTSHDIDMLKRTVDLFSRIKNTDQAELISTIIFSFEILSNDNLDVTENDVYEYILEWKPKWKEEKEEELQAAIRALAAFNFISPKYSENFLSTDVLI